MSLFKNGTQQCESVLSKKVLAQVHIILSGVGSCYTKGSMLIKTPLPFSFDTKKMYELVEPGNPENRTKKIWVAELHHGASERFCSLNVCFRPEGEQTRLAVIFRG